MNKEHNFVEPNTIDTNSLIFQSYEDSTLRGGSLRKSHALDLVQESLHNMYKLLQDLFAFVPRLHKI